MVFEKERRLRAINTSCSFLFCLLLLLFFDDLWSDSVHIGGSFFGKSLSVALYWTIIGLVADETNKTSILELLEAISNDFTTSSSVVRWASSPSLLATVVWSESWDSDFASHVELVSNGCCSYVKPVSVIWCEILETGSLNKSSPLLNII